MALGSIFGASSGYAPLGSDMVRNVSPEEVAQRWADHEAMIRNEHRDQVCRIALIAARKARAAEFRKAQPRKRYEDL